MTVRPLFLLVAAIIYLQGTAAAQFALKPAITGTEPAQQSADEHASDTFITVPAGTTVLMTLKSPLNTVSAQSGSGLYLETTTNVIQQNRIVIPAKTLVQGVVERRARPGRVKGRGQLQFHFTTLIFPDNYTAMIAGSLQSLPGSRLYEKVRQEGTIQPVDQIDKDAAVIVGSTAAGATIGSLTRGAFGAGTGALIGAGFGLGRVLFKRGEDIHLPAGTQFEIVLDRSLTMPLDELAPYNHRTDPPIMKPTSPSASPDEKRTPHFPYATNVAIRPGGTREFEFQW